MYLKNERFDLDWKTNDKCMDQFRFDRDGICELAEQIICSHLSR